MSKQKAEAIYKEWQETGKERITPIWRYKLVQEGFNYCSTCNGIKPVDEFNEADTDYGYAPKCKEHESVSGGPSGPTVESFLPAANMKDPDKIIAHFEALLDVEIGKGPGTSEKRLARTFKQAVEKYAKLGVHYCPQCKHVHLERPKEVRKERSDAKKKKK